MLWWKCVTGC